MNQSLALQELPFTGERLVAGQQHDHVQMIFEHLHRYYLAADICVGRKVLDIACGEGYGSNLIAQKAREVIGVDNSAPVILHAAAKYGGNNLKFLTGDCLKIPLPRSSVDVVVSFETIEHISQHEKFMSEIKRVLRPGGVLVISSPDKAESSDRFGHHNPYHVRELYRNDFFSLLRHHFTHCLPLQQRLVGGSYVAAESHARETALIYGTHRGDFSGGTFNEGVHEGVYCLAVCSDGPLPEVRLGLFENKLSSAQMWDLYETAPQRATEMQELRDKLRLLDEQSRQREQELSTSKPAEGQMAELNAEIVRRGDWGLQLQSELTGLQQSLAERDRVIEQLRLQEEAWSAEKKTRFELESALQEAKLGAEAAQKKIQLAHETERRHWQEGLQSLETELSKQRERTESNELVVVGLRAEVERKHDQSKQLTLRLVAVERENELARADWAKEREEWLTEGHKRQTGVRESSTRYEEQLAAAQTQLAKAMEESQRAMLWGNKLAEDLRRERLTSAELQGPAHELKQMKISWSWRLTAPLRRIHQALGDPLYWRKS